MYAYMVEAKLRNGQGRSPDPMKRDNKQIEDFYNKVGTVKLGRCQEEVGKGSSK